MPTAEAEAKIEQLLCEGIDWSIFARKAVAHGLAGLCGYTLARVAPDMMPEDILNAFQLNLEHARKKNRVLFDELGKVVDGLAKEGIEALPFKGPVLAIEAYGDLGFRTFGDLDFLVRDADMARTMATLGNLGYERTPGLSDAQIRLIQHLQGQDFAYKKSPAIGLEPHTRLIPRKMALDIDYAGLWRRTRPMTINDRTMTGLAPEDHFLVLAIHGGKELWWRIVWASDVAAFIAAHPNLDWHAIVESARRQGCLRMVLLAVSLARKYFDAVLPQEIVAAELSDMVLEPISRRVLQGWLAERPEGPPSNKTVSFDRLRLHDGIIRRARYLTKTWLLPSPFHIAWVALPRGLSFAYVPLALLHDLILLPLWLGYRGICKRLGGFRNFLASRNAPFAAAFFPAGERKRLKSLYGLQAEAKRILEANPDSPGGWYRLGDALAGFKRYERAIACYDKALTLASDNRDLWVKRNAALRALGKSADNSEITDGPKPADAKGWTSRAGWLFASRRYGEAAEAAEQALHLDPNLVAAKRLGILARLSACDWRKAERDATQVLEAVKMRQPLLPGISHRALRDSEREHSLALPVYARNYPPADKTLWSGERYHHDKIRIAYVSADLRMHALSVVMVGCFECHDKTRFETTAISLMPSDGSELRKRLEPAFDHFIEAQGMTDTEIAGELRRLEIDIVVDLNGYTGGSRSGIFAHRAAPVQVNYLGFPGSMGLPFIDYIIADSTIIPEKHQTYYQENVAYLPHTYMPSDNNRKISESVPSRFEAGLPDSGFVFACFNTTHKIRPEIFNVWMRLLSRVEGSWLWLRIDDPIALANLRREAAARGVAPGRIIPATFVSEEADHLARLRAADLFLDTLPYNAHATACDALWAGLPVVTCRGDAFAGRVGASLLRALEMPELIATSLEEYEKLAVDLALDSERLAAIRAKLTQKRESAPLFDTKSFTRNLESAFATMWERTQAGLPPASFSVEDASHETRP
jgi:predicted O-linked N-acetylglucosamine transferase (SPINDLY family)